MYKYIDNYVNTNHVTQFPYPLHLPPGADWTVGKSVIYRIKFTKKKKKKKKEKKEKEKKRKKKKKKKKKIHKERPKQLDQKGPLIYALNLTGKGLQIFMRRI